MNIRTLLNISGKRYTTAQTLRWLWRSWRGNRVQAVLNAAIGLAEVAVSLTQVWAVKRAIDIAAGNVPGSIYAAVGVMALLTLTYFALGVSGLWVKNILGVKAQNRMQQRILDRVLRSEWQGREARHSGDVVNRMEFDVVTVVNFLTETIPGTLSVLAMFLGAFSYLFVMDHRLALIVIVIIPVFALLSKVYMRRMRKLTRLVRDSDSKVQSTLQEAVQNGMLIKTLEGADYTIDRLADTHRELRRNVVRRTGLSVFSRTTLNVGFAAGYLVAFLWAAVRMSSDTLTFGGMTAFLQLVNRIQSPARSLTKIVPAFVNVFIAAERLMELEDNPLEEQGEPCPVGAPCGLRFSNVSYAYAGGGNIVDNFTFDFRPGTCTAILGETGAGKTTLVRLMLALIRPQSGSVEVYSNEISQQLSPLTRCNFAYVPQGNTLMSGTIRDNLLMGKCDATDEEMMEALRRSQADFVADLPDGLDTVCSEQGTGLSEGQAQRISVARALLRNRPVLLLDEATSALDPDTECRLLDSLLADATKTVVFVTHRTAVAEHCDATITVERRAEV